MHVDDVRVSGRFYQIECGKTSLYISLYPEALTLYLAKSHKQGFEKKHFFSNELTSCKIVRLEQSDFLPAVTIALQKQETGKLSDYSLELSFYRQAPNMSLVTARSRRSVYDRIITKQPKTSLLDIDAESAEQLLTLNRRDREGQIIKTIEGVDKFLAHELTPDRMSAIREIMKGEKHTYSLVQINPLQISIFSQKGLKRSTSLNALFEHATSLYRQGRETVERELRIKTLQRNLKRRIKRLQNKLLSDNDIERLRINGELILSYVTRVQKGSTHVNLEDPYTGKIRVIELDARKTPQENAQHYFVKYKKVKRGQPLLLKRIRELEAQLQSIDIDTITASDTPDVSVKEEKKTEPFRIFHLASGALVFVGKNARSNDELTFSFARPNDYFFHVRGYEGAHVILRATIPKGQRPRREDVKSAGAIAAYFSKARTQHNVAVSYTQRKYLKKAKKGKRGTVVLMREEVLFVDPVKPG